MRWSSTNAPMGLTTSGSKDRVQRVHPPIWVVIFEQCCHLEPGACLTPFHCTLIAGATANDDAFTTPANRVLSAVVSANDDNLNGTKVTQYSYSLATNPQFFAPGATTPQFLAGLVFNASGGITFNPAAQQLKAGTRVTFNYTIFASPSNYRSNTGMVTIIITDALTGGLMLPRAHPMMMRTDART